jgi:hypothetical protein
LGDVFYFTAGRAGKKIQVYNIKEINRLSYFFSQGDGFINGWLAGPPRIAQIIPGMISLQLGKGKREPHS